MKPPDSHQWDGITEDSLFLNDGLLRVADLITIPPEICSADSVSHITWDVETSVELSSQQLAKQIEKMYCYKSSSYQRFQDYRLCALKGFWESQMPEQDLEPTISSSSISMKTQNSSNLPFTSRVSLLLIFPLLEVQSVTNPELCKATSKLLIDCLKDCKPLSLANEPQDCLDGLENLICKWINDERFVSGNEEKACLASTLVILACARGSIRMMLSTLHTVQKLDCADLSVSTMLRELLETSGGPGVPTSLNGNLHHLCWDHSDVISVPADINNSKENNKSKEVPRTLGSDGKYLYMTGCTGAGLARIGTGRAGTLRGVVYARNLHISQGWVTFAHGKLIFRGSGADTKNSPFCQLLNPSTLQVESDVELTNMLDGIANISTTTLSLCSDGLYIYWVTCSSVVVRSGSNKSNKSLTIFVDVLEFCEGEDGVVQLSPAKDRITLQRKDVEASKSLTEALIEKLRPVRSSNTNMALEAIQLLAATAKDDNAQTSCGLTLKVLRKTPMYTCGKHLVMFVPVSSSARSGQPSALFVPALAAPSPAKGIATSLCFSLSDGQLEQRVDLTDAPGCALAKGSSLCSMGACYDVENNTIWTCSDEWVEEWGNPGNMAPHHIASRLGVVPTPQPDTPVSMNDVVTILLHHLGSTCCHQTDTDQKVVPDITPCYLSQLSDILSSVTSNEQQLHCVLVLLNLSMQSLDSVSQELVDSVTALREQVWKILSSNYSEAILKAASKILSHSFEMFYSSEESQHVMVIELIKASQRPGCHILQTSVFSHIRAQLDSSPAEEHSAWCSPHIMETVFSAATTESCTLVGNVVTLGNEEFKALVSHMPQRSPCISLLGSIQSHLCRHSLSKWEDKEVVGELFKYVKFSLQQCRKVYEAVLSVCAGLDELETVHMETRLQMLERLIKSSTLGLILPPLLCLLCDKKLHTLNFSHTLLQMFSDVSVIACKAATAVHDKMKLLSSDSIIIEDGVERPEQFQEYLSSLSVPAPWAAGRTVETIHPVRDNYKFKDTVTIPGARRIFLRFDPRCATQYDYDKVIIYAGASTSSRKVAEYGGNTYGFGSRSVLGTGWPTDQVKVEGDTVTFSFEMRSGREHNTPDRAIWGFACSVRAQESAEEDMLGMAVLADTALGLSTLSCHALRVLYEGAPPSGEELLCRDLMQSKLLQRCVWKAANVGSLIRDTGVNADSIDRLRILCGKPGPVFRPSLKEIVQPQEIEIAVMVVAMKHLRFQLDVEKFEMDTDTSSIVNKVLFRLNAMLRKLQNLAELEQRWDSERGDVLSGSRDVQDAFFNSYHLHENKLGELEMLCFITGVGYEEGAGAETSVKELILLVGNQEVEKEELSKTKWMLSMLHERLSVLMSVDVITEPVFDRTTSLAYVIKEETEEVEYNRSFSAPSFLEGKHEEEKLSAYQQSLTVAQDLQKLRKKKTRSEKREGYNISGMDEVSTGPVDDLFKFIGSEPNKAISCETFLAAAELRHERGKARSKALKLMHHLLTKAEEAKSVTHIVQDIATMLRCGPRSDELHCGGMTEQVRTDFSSTLQLLVKLTASHLAQCSETVALVCIIPFSRTDDTCLLTSGLLKLIDALLAGSISPNRDMETQQQISSVAWAGFRVLAHRCTSWESQDQSWEMSALASQVAMVLTNHLARAIDSAGVQDTAGNDILHNVLSLLLKLSKTRLGQAIISQGVCISHLLYLLVDHRPSPKLILTVLQLLRLALPLLSANQCSFVTLPTPAQGDNTASNIIHLLVDKLGEYLVPGSPADTIKLIPSLVNQTNESRSDPNLQDPNKVMCFNQRVTVYIHKRPNQQPHEVIQPLISADTRLFSQTTYMEKIIQMDRSMSQSGKAELLTDEFRVCARKAAKWAASGFIISIEPPAADEGQGEQRHHNTEHLCYEKNKDILRSDPVRPFISGQVASSLASKVISLLHVLLTTSSSLRWSKAIEEVLGASLSKSSDMISDLTSSASGSSTSNMGCLLKNARQLMAVLAALGGFKEYIRTGSHVQVKGEVITEGVVAALSERQGVASVVDDAGVEMSCPIARLMPPRKEVLPIDSLDITSQLVEVLHRFIKLSLPPDPGCGDASTSSHVACRILAELKTRAFMVLSLEVREPSFADEFLSHNNDITETMSTIAHICTSGNRLSVIESLCEHLRMVYHDCAHPPPPPLPKKQPQMVQTRWESCCDYPTVRGTIFSQFSTCLHFLGDVTPPPGQPKGVLIYANTRIPSSANSYYYEIQLLQSGDSPEEQGGNIVSFGFAPPPPSTSSTSSWTNPSGTVLFHSNGRAYHYCGPTILAWKSVRLNCSVKVGDIAGIGWIVANPAVGRVYFTLNGMVLQGEQQDVPAGLFPVIHIHRKGVRVRANFGTQPFKYTPNETPEEGTPAVSPAGSEERLSEILPIGAFSETESESESGGVTSSRGGGAAKIPAHDAPQLLPLQEYNISTSMKCKLPCAYTNLVETGPNTKGSIVDEEEVVLEEEVEEQRQDHYSLLVRAWEAKVFPVIRRRFRNEQERRSGLEQIKGALLLGMTEIARQTVDFLYEDNGGRPKDLMLPTLDDIKEDLAKFTVDRLRTGMTVVIKPDPNEGNKFSVCGMHYTYGLHGIVLSVDYSNELVQVETYLRQEGILVRFWYPLSVLERPLHHQMSAASTCNVDVKDCVVHRQMLYHESILANLYCRSALLALVENPRPFFKLPRQLSSRAASHTNSPSEDLESCTSSSISLPVSGISADCLEPPNTEYINMLSKELLRGPQPNGTVPPLTESCSQGARYVLDYNNLIPSRLFYRDSARLKDALNKMISNASDEECTLMSLTSRFCKILNDSPNKFVMDSVRLSETKASYDVNFPQAAYVYVSCRVTSLDEKSCDNYPKCPWIRVFAHNGSQGLARDGQPLRQEVVHYPYNSTTYSTAYQEPASVSVQSLPRFPTVMIPFDRVHVRTIASTPSPPVQVHLHSIPAEFCLAMSYIECLIELANSSLCPTSILLYCAEAVCKVLRRVDVVAPIKELLFHTLAELIRLIPSTTPSLANLSTKLKPFQTELLSLFSHQLKANGVSKKKVVSLKDLRISTYFQGLVELVFALREIVPETVTSPKPETSGCGEEDSKEGEETKSSPLVKRSKSGGGERAVLTKRRKIRVKQRGRDSTKSPPDPDSESSLVMPWFEMALSSDLMLRHLVDNLPRGEEGVKQGLIQLREKLTLSTPTSRLIVICGLPTFYSRDRVEATITGLCVTFGGVVEGEVFVPAHHFPLPPCSKDEQLCKGVAVLQLNCFEKVKEVVEVIQENKFLKGDVSGGSNNSDNNRAYCVVTLASNLICSSDNSALISSAVELYATHKLLSTEGALTPQTQSVLSDIFSRCPGSRPLSELAFVEPSEENLLGTFAACYDEDLVNTRNLIYGEVGETFEDSEELCLSSTAFISWCTSQAKKCPVLLLRCILATGHDLQYNLLYPTEPEYLCKLSEYSNSMLDQTIVRYVNILCKSRGLSSNRIAPQEILMTSSDRSDPGLAPLCNTPIEYLRLRFALLQVVNTSISKHLLPVVSLGTLSLATHSIGSVLLRGRDLLFYDVKLNYLNYVINSTDKRSGESVPPEIIFDPLTFVYQTDRHQDTTITMLAKHQLSRTPSSELCVKLASGGDPVFPFNVKLTGEAVQGTSGSFRYFMWLVAQELQSPSLPVLVECPSASAGENKAKFLLSPKNIDYHDEALLLFCGTLLGVAMRSDVPLAIDCLRPFWSRLLSEDLDFETDLRQSDIITSNFINGLNALKTEREFKEMVVKTCPTHFSNEECAPGCPYKFTYASLDGREVSLRAGNPVITWANLQLFVESVRELRKCELNAGNMIPLIQCGIRSIVPLEPLRLMGPLDLELRICGQQHIDIGFIKLHTIYQVGISQSDKHIEYFWNVVESLSQEDLRKLIKFACNQERIPFSCPCQESGPETSHVPPYPMKIAPAEGRDERLIRSETCMFLIKLPQYSSEAIMKERILQAINCRDDPLSG